MTNLPPGARKTELTMASTVSLEDTVIIVQGGRTKKLPVAQLSTSVGKEGASGCSGFSGFSGEVGISGFSGLNGDFAASGFSGFSGTSGFSGFSGQSPIIDIKPTYLVYSDKNGKITELPSISSNGETLEFTYLGDAPQISIKPSADSFKSIQVTANNHESTIVFHTKPYSSNAITCEPESGDLVIKSSVYGKETADIIRIKNSDQNIYLTKKLTTAIPSKEAAGFNLPLGERPEAINDGDMWREVTGVYFQTDNRIIGPISSQVNITNWNKTDLKLLASGVIRELGDCTSKHIFIRRVGDSMDCRIDIRQIKGIDGTSGEYLIEVPNNLTIDIDKINFMEELCFGSIGSGTLYDGNPNNITFQPRDSTHLAVIVNNKTWSSDNHNLTANVFNVIGTFTIPITEWK